jgi:6-phosphogluconolactonase (cycloisomerase 2 family)
MSSGQAIYLQTNDADRNELVAFRRADDGSLEKLGTYETGGRGTGQPHLPSQNSIVVAGDGSGVLVVNAGSDDLSLFAIEDDRLRLSDRVAAGGETPTSVTEHDGLVYVLANGSSAISGFGLADGKLEPLPDSTRSLSTPAADPAQISFSPDGRTLVVTERATNSITTFSVDERGYAGEGATIRSAGETPYGFDFTREGGIVVTEAFGGAVGKAAASSYRLVGDRLERASGSVADTRSEVCWAAVTKDGRFVYVTNFGDGTISSYEIGSDGTIELANPVAAATRLGEAGIRDEAITADGEYLYALDADAQRVHGWRIGADGSLVEIGSYDGLPATVAGLAAR